MSNFIGDNINAIRIHYGLSQERFAEAIGTSQTTVSAWECGDSTPRKSNVEKILAALTDLQFDDVMSEERGFAKKVMAAGQHKIPVRGMKTASVPLVRRVHAGDAVDPDDLMGRGETVDIPDFLLAADADCYACEVEGDCMNRVYPTGCVVVVSPNRPPQNGSVAVVDIEGMGTVMRRMYRTQKTLVLSPDSFNPEHEDIIVTSDDDRTVKFGGKVVWFQPLEEMA